MIGKKERKKGTRKREREKTEGKKEEDRKGENEGWRQEREMMQQSFAESLRCSFGNGSSAAAAAAAATAAKTLRSLSAYLEVSLTNLHVSKIELRQLAQ